MDFIILKDVKERKEEERCFACGYRLYCRSCQFRKKHKQRRKRKVFKIPEKDVDLTSHHIFFEGYFREGYIVTF